ncbi:B3 domain-containing protein Os01g0234100-like isoform X2 [Durio zibethinus]|uniref:B3 domain-containing protein Os01g0234100-like isoform X2 n=1 Tax=Durio zibethinus TaxID=66656 RepID=A0A6P5YJA4_DURZI|nr:B3 domain-containing protein Os01g0234100-like isoform X2 [Durio zibethinus]
MEDQRVKKEAEEIQQRTTSFADRRLKSAGEEDLTLAQLSHTPIFKPSSSKAKRLTERKQKRMKSQSESIIEHAVSDSEGKLRSSKKNKSVDDGKCNPEIKSPAMIRAEEVQSNLEPEFPSFAKSLVRSHVGSCFWMGLPGMFCRVHLPRKDTTITLEDESGHQFHVKYYAHKTGLSAGWRQFCSAHNLLEGDVLVFQLVEPTKFKVYIIRANDLTELDGALGLLNLDAHTKQSDADDAENDTTVFRSTKRKRPNSLPLADVQKKNKRSGLQRLACNIGMLAEQSKNAHTKQSDADDAERDTTVFRSIKRKRPISLSLVVVQKKNKRSGLQRLACNIGIPAEQSENDSEEVGSEVWEGFKQSVPTIQFKDITSFENFKILVDGLVIDSELSEDIRIKYYKLCCSQNSFLHENIIQGINFKLIVGTILETVNISDAIRACKLTTSRDEFDGWDKTLKAFELLGMNVGFLLTRLRRLVNLAFESAGAADTRRYIEAQTEQAQTQDEIRNLEAKLAELKGACKTFGVEIESLQSKAETYKLRFEEEVKAPW